ncbi:MAG: MBOAT family protein [Leptospiraceae bacterium]|nr:MBOAT family protein [Leptospiraceae bacterium]
MFFNSVDYFIFAPLVIVVFFLLRDRGQRIWLLLASLFFYAVFRVPFTALLLFSILVTYYAVRGMNRASGAGLRRLYLTLAVISNLAILYFFKYIDFSIQVFNALFFLEPCDDWYLHPVGVILPMGISFFSLQAIAYAVDVYRGVIPAGTSVFQFGLFLSFFPQLVAGPSMRAQDLLDQFAEQHPFRYDNLRVGLGILALGFYKKTFIADPAGVLVDRVFGEPGAYSWEAMLLSVFLHSMQIYGDFSGYSDIAIGTARIMGFRIPMNFNRPFLSHTMTEFWNRWHISLSNWLRDYVYIPLGGNRVSIPRSYVNVFLTMVVSGIWHGSGANFVIWGLIHASAVVIERFVFSFETIRKFYQNRIPGILKILYSYTIFSLAFYWFRAQAVPGIGAPADVAWYMASRTMELAPGDSLHLPFSLLLSIISLMVVEFVQEKRAHAFDGLLKNNVFYYFLVLGILSYCLVVYTISDSVPFVYFRF